MLNKHLCFKKLYATIFFLLSSPVAAGKIDVNKIYSLCKKHKFSDCKLIEALIRVESNFNSESYNPEKTGSFGLLQIQCGTAKWMGFRSCKKLYEPSYNIAVGVKYLKFLRDAHKIQDLKSWIASWNAGKPIICKFYNKNKCKPGEFYNQNYVNKVYDIYLALSNKDMEVKNGFSKMGKKNRQNATN